MYSLVDAPPTATIPTEWDIRSVTGFALSPDKKEPLKLEWDGRKVKVAMRARQPVMLCRHKLG